MAQNIPLNLQATPAPDTVSYVTFNQLMQLVAQYLTASINTAVSFFLTGTTDPVVDQGVIFYNTAQGYFKAWSTAAGSYVVTGVTIRPGDLVQDYLAGDELSRGLVLLDGRVINNIVTLSANQNAALHTLFGAGAGQVIPTIAATGTPNYYTKVFAEFPLT